MDTDKSIHPRASVCVRGLISLCLALLSYFWFPGHTWLQQDSQLYLPILQHQHTPALLRNDPVATQPHTAYTIYDEAALALRAAGLDFHTALAAEQIAARALGIWGLYLIATAAGLTAGPAWLAAVIVALGAFIKGPEVITFEYEPTPRAIAIPLVMLAVGLAAHGRMTAAALAGACAFLFHPPAALPFWAVFAVLNIRRWTRILPLIAGIALLLVTGSGAHQAFFGKLAPMDAQLMHLRTAYIFISSWPRTFVWHYAIVAAILALAWWRVRGNGLLMAMAVIGILSMPVSFLLLEVAQWRLLPQLQPMRWLLFTTLDMQIMAAIAGIRSFRSPPLTDARSSDRSRSLLLERERAGATFESIAWLTVAFLPSLQPVFTQDLHWQHFAVALGLAAAATAALAWKIAPAAGLAAFFAVPVLGGVVNYPALHTPEMARLVEWARASTSPDAVFVFPQAGHSTEPGIFRAEAQRALYVDWKSGGQMVYLPGFGFQWWFRWQQVQGAGLAKLDALGIRYAVVKRAGDYAVYDTHTGMPARQSK